MPRTSAWSPPYRTLAEGMPRLCRCGNDRDHYMVSADARYSWLGWLLLLAGASARPRVVVFICRVCERAFDESNDPLVLKENTGKGR